MSLKKDKPFITRRKKKEDVKQEEEVKKETLEETKKEEKTKKAVVEEKKQKPKSKEKPKAKTKKTKKQVKKEIKNEIKVGLVSKEILKKEKKKSNSNQEILKEFLSYKRKRVVLWGIVSGIETEEQNIKVTILYNNIPISIKDNNYFDSNFRFSPEYASLSKQDKLDDKNFKIMTSVGSICPFIIIKAVEENGELNIVGSRTDALNKLRDIYFYHRYCAKNEMQEVKEGQILQANVIYVCEQFATIELCGVETRLSIHTASEYPISNCKEALKVGDVIKVKIKKIHINEDSIYLKVTRRLGLGKQVINKIKEGDTRLCVVDSYSRSKDSYTCKYKVDEEHYINVTVNRSSVNGHLELNVGDTVSVKIVKVNKEDGYAIGSAFKLG